GDGRSGNHPDRHALLATGVDVTGVTQRDLGVRRVQATDMAVGQAATRPYEDFPQLAVLGHAACSIARTGWAVLAAYAAAASRTQAPSSCARFRFATRCRLHGPLPLMTCISSSYSGWVKS